MLLQQRKLLKAIPAAFTNTTPSLIGDLESLADEQDQTADLMIPLKGKLLQAISQSQSSGNNTNAQQQLAQVNAFAEAIRDQLFGVSTALRDLDRSAAPSAAQAESSLYTLWKGIAGYQQLLREDIERQTNAMIAVQGKTRKDDQSEALLLTGLFKERFEQTVPPEGLSKPVEQTSTNKPSGTNTTEVILSAEDRAKIVTLADQAIATQTIAKDIIATNLTGALPHQRQAHALLKEIEKLLPKEKQPQDNSQQQDQKDNQQQKNQPKDPPKEQPKEQKKPEKQEPQKGEMSKEDLQRMLEKAKQREKEHEQEKRERENAIPMSPAERDW